MTHFVNFLSAVATVGAQNFTQQSSNIPLMIPLNIPDLSLNHLEQLQKNSENQVWAPHFGGTFGPSGLPEQDLLFQMADLKFLRRKTKLDLQKSCTDLAYKSLVAHHICARVGAKHSSKQASWRLNYVSNQHPKHP